MSEANGQSVQSDVLDAVVAVLGGAGASVYLAQFRPFADSQLPADEVLPEQEESEIQSSSSTGNKFSFNVRHLAAAAEGATPSVLKVADQRYVRAAKLLLADPTLGGLVLATRMVRRKWEMERSELQIVALVVTYETDFSTSRSDPSVAGY